MRHPLILCLALTLATESDLRAAAEEPTNAPPSAAEAQPVPIFEELEGMGLDFVHFTGMTGDFYMAEINCGGGALLDFDNDGDLDLYLVQGGILAPGKPLSAALFPPRHPPPLTDRLYRNDLVVRPDGRRELRFTDVTAESGELGRGYGFGVAAGDVDNDGWVDLYVTQLGANALLHNNGDGTFTDVTKKTGSDDERWSVPVSMADFDADGWLDLYVGNYLSFSLANHKTCRTATGALDYCGPTAYPGVTDRLLRNRGDGTFEDVTAKRGLLSERSKSLGVVAVDLDRNGRLDFYVANDLAPNQMWLQQADGRFVNEALLAGTAVNGKGTAEASMGVAAADFDGDGDDDLFMTHLTRETNTLYRNDGSGMFDDATTPAGLGTPSWSYTSWGTATLDYDNDGRLEMMVANGAVRIIEELANRGDPYPFHQRNQLFRNLGENRFEEVTGLAGPAFERSEVSRALAVGDLDNDGDSDVLLVNNNGPARLLLNTVGQGRSWLGLRLVSGEPARDMLGARVELRREGRPSLWRRAHSDGSFASARDPRVLFGLGDDDTVAEVRVHWPNGEVEAWREVPARRYSTLYQGKGKKIP